MRLEGGELLHGGADAEVVSKLYERVAVGGPGRSVYVSGKAFQAFADLAGMPLRELVRRLPPRSLNAEPARPR